MRLTFGSRYTLPAVGSTLAVLATIASAGALAITASAMPLRSATPPCGFVAQAAPWSYKGQKGPPTQSSPRAERNARPHEPGCHGLPGSTPPSI